MEGTPKNLLSFLYNVTYDMDLKKRFHADPTGEMGNFDLSRDAIAALNKMGTDRNEDPATKEQAVGQLMNCLQAEIMSDEYQKIW